jgi:glycosyltransferase involved in cell wall biosynthesis
MTARRKTLLLIDSATSGCAGAYIDAIYRRLRQREGVEVAVSHYFPFAYGKKIFYKYSELAVQRKYKLGRARLYVRFFELLRSFLYLFGYVKAARIRIVCYALSSNLTLEYMFLAAIKTFTKAKVYVICHDVIPFVGSGDRLDDMVRKRSRFYRLADKLIVHNANSAEDLEATFGVADKVLSFPFPIYELNRIGLAEVAVLPPAKGRRFLFIGHLRVEKGIDVLLEAWIRFHRERPQAELIIAGNVPAGRTYSFEAVADAGVTPITHYLSDEEYVALIREADCVVLPYSRGTNSAVVSTVLFLRKNLIVSDIGMFAANPLIPKQSFFARNDPESLTRRLMYFHDLSETTNLLRGTDAEQRFEAYEKEFDKAVNSVFDLASVNIP